MQIKETIGVSFPASIESPPLEDVVVLVDSAGVALGVQRAFSARVRGVRDGDSGLIASRYVEIPLVGADGEVSGILCHTRPLSDTRGAVGADGRARVRATADEAQRRHVSRAARVRGTTHLHDILVGRSTRDPEPGSNGGMRSRPPRSAHT